MKRLLLLFLLLIGISPLRANDQVQNLQSSLQAEGFYFGEVDGKPSAELNAAIRRYQIRNGLSVTGEADEDTLGALGLTSPSPKKAEPSAPAPKAETPPPSPRPVAPGARPPVDLRKDRNLRGGDQEFLGEDSFRSRPIPGDRSMVRPPVPLDPDAAEGAAPSEAYVDIFTGTPYERAPEVVQRQTIERAQAVLASRGFYRDRIDGSAGPATEEAILTYQRSARLPLTGRLDLQTLARLRLLPGRGTGNPAPRPLSPGAERAPRQQVYRGIWVE